MDATILETVELKRLFKAPRSKVFAAWTEPEAVAAWMGPVGVEASVDILDVRPGGRYHYTLCGDDENHPVGGEFLEVIDGERLVFTWTWEFGELAGVETVVELNFRDHDGGTELTLIHSKLPTPTAREKHTGGWASCFDRLQPYLDS